ncbi:mannose-1-phosphate guanylyltransferase [Cellulomonas bogoriensis]|uniref:Mannose-1-phosphate guanylyltransferase n=1 Tax=Cellulomonas bogoriensis 69B4 = DSM 16987 TaxID=1386082 RepID=A0A0A0C1U6_9CELL|nr:mannose-1-phosphate guanylyltransferase [Cellulomonas bogoriensis]KGM13349.1 mannose-1-phosphate guanylyltransferase [Cellulomonas bogoriensis 69B4 = DSM 16987]
MQTRAGSARLEGFRAVVPAGGAGTRLWPVSRRGAPKFLQDLDGSGRTLLQATADRLEPLTGPDGVLVVTGAAHEEAVRAQLPGLGAGQVLAEPSPRDSMAAIGLAAAVLREREGDVVLGSFAADHVITDVPAFHDAVTQGVAAARAGYVATVGIVPTSPATGFGYVHLGEALGVDGAPQGRRVRSFTEKPDAATARAYLDAGEHLWNAGMFLVRAQVLLEHLAVQRPALHDGLCAVAAAWDTPQRGEVLQRTWPGLERIAIDHAIAEPVAAAGGVAVVPGTFGWDDVGDFASLATLLDRTADPDGGARVVGPGHVVQVDVDGGLVVPAGGRTVALVGVEDLVVVDTPDALLVTTRAQAQRVRAVVDRLQEAGREDLL